MLFDRWEEMRARPASEPAQEPARWDRDSGRHHRVSQAQGGLAASPWGRLYYVQPVARRC